MPALGGPIEARIVRTNDDSGMLCDKEVAVARGGNVLIHGIDAYTAGHWQSAVGVVAPDGTSVGGGKYWYVTIVPGARGFLSYLGTVETHGDDFALLGTRSIPWTMQPVYDGLLAATPDGHGGLLVASAGADSSQDAMIEIAKAPADGTISIAPFPAVTIPAPNTSWWQDGNRFHPPLEGAIDRFTIGEDGAGRILIAWEGQTACGPGTIAARWFSPDGQPLGPVFRAARGMAPRSGMNSWLWGIFTMRLYRLLDGSLVLQRDGTYVRRFADGVPAGGDVPMWLGARNGERLVALPWPGLLGALHPADTATGAPPSIDVVAADGTVCGDYVLPPQAGDPLAAWYAGMGSSGSPFPTIGPEGTIVQFNGVELTSDPSDRLICVYRIWPGALR